MVALAPVAVVYLGSCRDLLQRDDGEGLQRVVELPFGLPRSEVVQHVGIWDHGGRLHAVDHETKVATAHTHPRPLELLQRRYGAELGHYIADGDVVVLDSCVALLYLLH